MVSTTVLRMSIGVAAKPSNDFPGRVLLARFNNGALRALHEFATAVARRD